jgi:hypothetical protein
MLAGLLAEAFKPLDVMMTTPHILQVLATPKALCHLSSSHMYHCRIAKE